MQPTDPNDEERLLELPEDNGTPFQAADPNPATTGNTTDPVVQDAASQDIPDDHPATDTEVNDHELYDEGLSGATEVTDESGQSAVTDYDPENDQRLE